MTHKAVLFDLDGTLIDSTADIAHTVNVLLKERGYPTHPLEAFRRFIGDGVQSLLLRALPSDAVERDPSRLAGMVEDYKKFHANHWNVQTYVYPGIPEMLARLASEGMKMSVLSNKPHAFTVKCVSHFLPAVKFEIVMGAGGGFPNKPDPAAAIHIASIMGIAPRDFLYLGDTDTDMKTAHAAGMFAVGVLWGLRDREELEKHHARAIIANPDELFSVK